MSIHAIITHAQYYILKRAYLYPNEARPFRGRFADMKNEMMQNHLLTYEGEMKYKITDLGQAKMEEYERHKQS